MKCSRLRSDEDSSCRRTQERRVRNPCVLCNVHGETETTVTVGTKGGRERERKSIIFVSPSRSIPAYPSSWRASSLFLPFRRTAPPHLRPLLHRHLPSVGLIFSPACFSLSSERKREKERDLGIYERTRNKKVIGSRYKGKFLRGSLNGNSDFSMVPISSVAFSIETDNDLSYSITLSDQSVLIVIAIIAKFIF